MGALRGEFQRGGPGSARHQSVLLLSPRPGRPGPPPFKPPKSGPPGRARPGKCQFPKSEQKSRKRGGFSPSGFKIGPSVAPGRGDTLMGLRGMWAVTRPWALATWEMAATGRGRRKKLSIPPWGLERVASPPGSGIHPDGWGPASHPGPGFMVGF